MKPLKEVRSWQICSTMFSPFSVVLGVVNSLLGTFCWRLKWDHEISGISHHLGFVPNYRSVLLSVSDEWALFISDILWTSRVSSQKHWEFYSISDPICPDSPFEKDIIEHNVVGHINDYRFLLLRGLQPNGPWNGKGYGKQLPKGRTMNKMVGWNLNLHIDGTLRLFRFLRLHRTLWFEREHIPWWSWANKRE